MTKETDRKLRRKVCFSPLAGDSDATKVRLTEMCSYIDTSGGLDKLLEHSSGAKLVREWRAEVQQLRFADHQASVA